MSVRTTTAIVVGAGPAGLAMGRELGLRGIDHVILDRGRVGEAWRSRPWQRMRLRTPNWMNGLPGAPYNGRNRHGYMAPSEFIARLQDYAGQTAANVDEHTEVLGVRALEPGFEIATNNRRYRCLSLILATGACAKPFVPACAEGIPSDVFQTTAAQYTLPEDLPPGRVLVVGAGASAVTIAAELQSAGRETVLAVGRHRRLPRQYRERDIEWWLDAIGWLDERESGAPGLGGPSPQLSGGPDPVDLGALHMRGVEIVGRLTGVHDGRATFGGDLADMCAHADVELARLLTRIDSWASRHISYGPSMPVDHLRPTPLPLAPKLDLDLHSGGVAAVVWASGFRPDHSFVHLPVFDRQDRLVHEGGIVAGPDGLYALGLPFLRRRRSSLISGFGRDARDIAEHLERCLKTERRRWRRRSRRSAIPSISVYAASRLQGA